MGFCENCGEKLEKEAEFCSKCGKKVEMNSLLSEPTMPVYNTTFITRLLHFCKKQCKIIFMVIILVAFIMLRSSFTDAKYVKVVQEGRHPLYPQLTVGETFNTLFDNQAEWNYNSDGECVTVSGICNYGGNDIVMTVGVSIENGEIGSYQFIRVDGEYVNFLELGSLINKIYVYAYEMNGLPID